MIAYFTVFEIQDLYVYVFAFQLNGKLYFFRLRQIWLPYFGANVSPICCPYLRI